MDKVDKFSKKNGINRMSNKTLLSFHNKIKKEQEHKKQYGDEGTGRYVSSSEFWGREGRAGIKRELEKRKEQGTISSNAGKSRRSSQPSLFNLGGGRRSKGLFGF